MTAEAVGDGRPRFRPEDACRKPTEKRARKNCWTMPRSIRNASSARLKQSICRIIFHKSLLVSFPQQKILATVSHIAAPCQPCESQLFIKFNNAKLRNAPQAEVAPVNNEKSSAGKRKAAERTMQDLFGGFCVKKDLQPPHWCQ